MLNTCTSFLPLIWPALLPNLTETSPRDQKIAEFTEINSKIEDSLTKFTIEEIVLYLFLNSVTAVQA